MLAWVLLAAELSGAATPCDPSALIRGAREASESKAKAEAWTAELTRFRSRCDDDPAWRELTQNADVKKALTGIKVPSGAPGSGTGKHTGGVRVSVEHEMTLLALKLTAAESACPGLKTCPRPEDKPLLAEAQSALKRYFARVGRGEGDLLEVTGLLRRFGGRLKDLSGGRLELALRAAPILSLLADANLSADDLNKFPDDLRKILEEEKTAARTKNLLDYFESRGKAVGKTLDLLQVVYGTERARQEVGERVRANQVKVLVDVSRVADLNVPCAVASRVRQAALPALVRSGFADDSGVYTGAEDCPGGDCPVTFAFDPAVCERSPSASGADPPQPGTAPPPPASGASALLPDCVVLRLRFGAGDVQQRPIPVARISLLCADGTAGREAVGEAMGKGLEDVLHYVALTSGPPELAAGALVPPEPIARETRLESSSWQAALWVDAGKDDRPPGFGNALAEWLQQNRSTGIAKVVYGGEPPPGATRLAWDTSEGPLVIRLVPASGTYDYLKLRFSLKEVAEQSPQTLAVATGLTVLNYYARNTPEDPPTPGEDTGPRPPRERAARGYNILLAGLPGLTDETGANDSRSKAFATADAILMGATALFATGAMVDRTLYHRGDADSLTWSRRMFVAAEVTLLGAAIVKAWALIKNP